ncbi:hypothetical protein G6F22_013332 [Rhizopus arrhizus]|nr:hypothetical protein G6F22_013332 [Rhizopus arrhizus]
MTAASCLRRADDAYPAADGRHEGPRHRRPAGLRRGGLHRAARLPGKHAGAPGPDGAARRVAPAAARQCAGTGGQLSGRVRSRSARGGSPAVAGRTCRTGRGRHARGTAPAGAGAVPRGQVAGGGRFRAGLHSPRVVTPRRQRGAGRTGLRQAPARILGADAQTRHRGRTVSAGGAGASGGVLKYRGSPRAAAEKVEMPGRTAADLRPSKPGLPAWRAFLKNDVFLRSLLREPVPYTPIWLMRQAGRYLPEYRATRARAGSFMGLAQNPDYAMEVTLQPLERFDLDAAILFSDILTVPHAMGLGLDFAEGEGPRFARPVRTEDDVARLAVPDMDKLRYVFDAVSVIRRELDGKGRAAPTTA